MGTLGGGRNGLKYSEDLTNPVWQTSYGVTATQLPDGTELIADGAYGDIRQTTRAAIPADRASKLTFFVRAKAGTCSTMVLKAGGTSTTVTHTLTSEFAWYAAQGIVYVGEGSYSTIGIGGGATNDGTIIVDKTMLVPEHAVWGDYDYAATTDTVYFYEDAPSPDAPAPKQYYTDFSSTPTGQAPADWTFHNFVAGEATVVDTAFARNGKELKINLGANARRAAIWNIVDAAMNAEVLVRFRTPAASPSRYPALVRANPSTMPGIKGYFAMLDSSNGVRGGRYDTSIAYLATPAVTKSIYRGIPEDKYVYLRMRVHNATYSVRMWNEDVTEPATWDIVDPAYDLPYKGLTGLFAYYGGDVTYIDSFGVGINGASAPDSPINTTTALFSADTLKVYAPAVVSFTDASSGAASWNWAFGDGGTSVEQNPVHTYTTPGVYTVTLSVNNGEALATRTNYITVLDPNAPTLSEDVDGGNIDIQESYVLPSGQDWSVYVQPRKQINDYITTASWWYFAFKLDGVHGKRPTFSVNWTDHVGKYVGMSSPKDIWAPYYSYTPHDPSSWVQAPVHTWAQPKASWQFTESFTQNSVYVAYAPMFTLTSIQTWMGSLSGITPIQGNETYTIGTLPATVTETGRTVPALPVLGFKAGYGPATMLVLSGIHPCEDHGSLVMKRFVENFLSSPQLQALYTLYCYPCVNPQGRWGRSYRGTYDTAGLTLDPARVWTDTPALKCVKLVRDSFVASLPGGYPDVMFDFHGHYQANYLHSVYGWNAVAKNSAVEHSYQSAVAASYPSLEIRDLSVVTQAPPYTSTLSAAGPAGMHVLVELSDWAQNISAVASAFGDVLSSKLSTVHSQVYGRCPVGAAPTALAAGATYGVQVISDAVQNAVEYQFYRDAAVIQPWTLSRTYLDTTAAQGVSYEYTVAARNPGGTTASGAASVAQRTPALLDVGRYGYKQSTFNATPFSTEVWGFK